MAFRHRRKQRAAFPGLHCFRASNSRNTEGRPSSEDANGPPVQEPGPPTTCRQNSLRRASGSHLWRKRLVPPRQFDRQSCLPTPVSFEGRNTAVTFVRPVGLDKWELEFLHRIVMKARTWTGVNVGAPVNPRMTKHTKPLSPSCTV